MLGPALTVKLRPGDNLMLHKATELVKDGYIVVCDTQGCTSYALLGELMASALKKQNAGGIVIDGVIRDCEEVIEVGLPVYARGSVNCAGDKGRGDQCSGLLRRRGGPSRRFHRRRRKWRGGDPQGGCGRRGCRCEEKDGLRGGPQAGDRGRNHSEGPILTAY